MLEHFLEESARRCGERVAVVAGDTRLTYAALDAASNVVAKDLTECGIAPGDRVGILLDNSLEAVIALFGVLKAGAAFVMLHPTTKGERLAYKLRDSAASALVLPGGKAAMASAILAACPALRWVVVAPSAGAPAANLPPSVQAVPLATTACDAGERAEPLAKRHIDADLAALLYTSGSTGEPKGVMLLHRNVTSAIRSIVSYLHLTEDDVLAIVLPLSFGYGLTQLFSALAVGARVVLEKGIAFPHVTLTKLTEERVTGLGMVPTIAAVLLGMDLSKYDLSSLRFVTNAGDALPIEHARKLRAALPKVSLICMYGQTECLRISYLEPDELERRMGSVGRGIPNQEHMLVGEDGQAPLPGAPGELVVRGSHVMSGYWGLPEQTAEKLRPGRLPGDRLLFTGDLFRADEDGYLYFVGRKDDILKTKGEKVSPREVEDALMKMPGVAEAAVVGVPDPILGVAIKAVIVLRPGVELAPRQVQGHCAQLLEDYMVPKIVEIRTELPKTDNGKVLRRALQ